MLATYSDLLKDESDINDYHPDAYHITNATFTLHPTNPINFLQNLKQQNPHNKFLHFLKGTTTLAFTYQGGAIVACDSRASMGSFVGTELCEKATPVTKYILITKAGTAADCQYWAIHLSELCRNYELRNGEPMSIAHTAKLLANIYYNYRGYGLGAAQFVAGWDQAKQCAEVYAVTSEGSFEKGHLFSHGSGSTYAYGILDSEYKHEMTKEEAIQLGRKSIAHATHRDAGSGGLVRVFHIDKNGWKAEIPGEDVSEAYKALNGMPH